jgi:hypothetical protein
LCGEEWFSDKVDFVASMACKSTRFFFVNLLFYSCCIW